MQKSQLSKKLLKSPRYFLIYWNVGVRYQVTMVTTMQIGNTRSLDLHNIQAICFSVIIISGSQIHTFSLKYLPMPVLKFHKKRMAKVNIFPQHNVGMIAEEGCWLSLIKSGLVMVKHRRELKDKRSTGSFAALCSQHTQHTCTCKLSTTWILECRVEITW